MTQKYTHFIGTRQAAQAAEKLTTYTAVGTRTITLSQNYTAVKAEDYCIKHWDLTLSNDSNCRQAVCNGQNQMIV